MPLFMINNGLLKLLCQIIATACDISLSRYIDTYTHLHDMYYMYIDVHVQCTLCILDLHYMYTFTCDMNQTVSRLATCTYMYVHTAYYMYSSSVHCIMYVYMYSRETP